MISIVIPTINRYKLLIKGLKFLNFQNFKGQIIIADSSDKNEFKKTSDFLNDNKHSFYFKHINCGKRPVFECIKFTAHLIKEKYCLWLPDDDYIIIKNIKAYCNILNLNKNISAVGGSILLAIVKDDKIKYFDKYNVKNLNIRIPDKRFFYHLNNYSVIQYSIQRSDDFIKRFKNIPSDIPSAFGNEFLPCFFLALSGRVIMRRSLLFVRTIHDDRIPLETGLGKNESWIKIKEKILNSILKYKNYYFDSEKITKENTENAILNLLNNTKTLVYAEKKINILKSKFFFIIHQLLNKKEITNIKKLIENIN